MYTLECRGCRGAVGGCAACEGTGQVPLCEADPRDVLRRLREEPLIEAAGAENFEPINGCDAVDLLCEIRVMLDEALGLVAVAPAAPVEVSVEAPEGAPVEAPAPPVTPMRRAPQVGPAAEATVAKAMQLVEHVRGLRLDDDHEAADGAAARLYTWALDAVSLDVPDARTIAAIARGA